MAIASDSDDGLSDTTLQWGRPLKTKKNEKRKNKKIKKNNATRKSRRKAMLYRHLLHAGLSGVLMRKKKKNITNAP